ncbi:GtrA family protein [Sphingopyxis granuli]|uniref:Polysaccharide biosynthesis protein GtrA n=1 Tax=Sphingopyxis granuli TaxID=267128 RepID=A0AA86GHY7_9SPHN|nr:GtrA family protein [Sphingopyxis granuli]AMG72649.1 Polysaccharide biosynthesis protein GtrA [Sphingopyxis granuli]
MMAMPLLPVAQRLMKATFLRYIGASAIALAGDMGLFMLFVAAGWLPAAAAATSYAAGIVIHWLTSSRLVFVEGARTEGMKRVRQKGLFLGSAFVGLGLTVAIVWAGDMGGIDPMLSKLIAVGLSFVVTYILRKTLVFAAA